MNKAILRGALLPIVFILLYPCKDSLAVSIITSFDAKLYPFADPADPEGLAWDGSYLWVVDDVGNEAYKVDPTTGNVIYYFSTKPFPYTSYYARDPEGLSWYDNYLWISDDVSDQIYKVDPASGKALSYLSIAAYSFEPEGLTYAGGYFWVVDDNSDEIYKVDPNTGNKLLSFAAPGSDCEGLGWDGVSLLVGDSELGMIYRVDPSTGAVQLSYDILSITKTPAGLAWDGRYLWVSSRGREKIYQLDIGAPIPEPMTILLLSSGLLFGVIRGYNFRTKLRE
jgi:DNA-binding beta-propeller fold protein YncE